MEEVKLYCRGVCCGEVVWQEEGGRVAISAGMNDPGDGLYRAVLAGDRGELSLGVMEPAEGKLVLRRKPERSEIARLGDGLRIYAGCAFPFRRQSSWTVSHQPEELLADEFLRSRLGDVSGAWWRRAQGRLMIALPLEEGKPFPLESIFCFAEIRRVETALCAVYGFDERGEPVQPQEKSEKNFAG